NVDKIFVYANSSVVSVGGAVVLKDDGSVIVWGGSNIADTSQVASQISSDVVDIYVGANVAIAKKSDDSYVIWGRIPAEVIVEMKEWLSGKTIISTANKNGSALVLVSDQGQAIYYDSIEQKIKYKNYLNSNIEKLLDPQTIVMLKKQDGSFFIQSNSEFGLHGSFHLDFREP
ncbi:MAG: hypothetical protein MK008_03570, partial [Bdellovibrionales bacterium]|nr:hypothetical protein [Bdellovibrionales bacterium]